MERKKTEPMESARCRLCLQPRKLLMSHIIPKGLLRIAKGKYSQLISMNVGENSMPRMDNVNWREKLLCEQCEKYLNLSYENSQIKKLKSAKDKVLSDKKITIINLDFKRFYLFWLSIIWRASESSLDEFSTVSFPGELSDVLRMAVLNGSAKYKGHDFDEFFQIGICRWYFDTTDSKSFLTTFKLVSDKNYIAYVFMVSGFAVIYQLSSEVARPLPQGFSLIKKSFVFKMNKIFPGDSAVVDGFIEDARKSAMKAPDFAIERLMKEI
ncbi:hypothetical protein BV326_04394 [Pseudomonas syringae pv. actinidiae]|uniref:hypothetical protein n=1 Tax=Pseudomonas syringae TaxID=317 RepID=UPI000A21C67F|nr:hypothetical protein [Pseudomonas syringae]OSR67278.1 hypothetical protein BV326_04394 [Pseudomonas syringae pv. actinidiae]